jgi:acyl-CoA synthetase (AMP-forming)/AMP-acid ligase II
MGNLLVLFTSPDTEAIIAAMERYQATVFYGVPTLYEYLKDHKDTDKANWKRLKLILSGADTLHESTVNGWVRRTGSKIIEGYGMSETAAISHINPLDRRRPARSAARWRWSRPRCSMPRRSNSSTRARPASWSSPGRTS